MLDKLDQANKNIRLGLDSIKEFLHFLWNPQFEFSVIHIAGTNGKGSVCLFLELMYRFFQPKLRIAKYTSPHLVSVTERIRVNGKNIAEEDFMRLYDVILRAKPEESSGSVLGDSLTEFEKITCVAFMYFKEQGVDLVIMETGLGGRLDATNICENKLATVITNIAMDHMDYLGNTLEKIRIEKEGIKRDSVPHYEGRDFSSVADPNSLTGENFLLALKVFEDLSDYKLTEAEKHRVLLAFGTESRARFDLDMDKQVLVDGAHNPAAARVLAQFIKSHIRDKKKCFIIGMMDKDFDGFLEALMPCVDLSRDSFIFTKVASARALDPQEMLLRATVGKDAIPKANIEITDSLAEAIKRSQGFKVITGSLYLAGEYYGMI